VQRKLRVLQVSSYGIGHPGGLESCAEMLSRCLPAQNCYAVWAFGSTDTPSARAHRVRYRVVDFFERRIGVPVPIPRLSACRTLFRLVRRCDVVLVHDFMYFTSAFAILLCILLRRRFVLMVHVWRINYSNLLLNLSQSIAHLFFGRPALRLASAIVTCSRENLRQIRRVRNQQTFFAPNGIYVAIKPSADSEPIDYDTIDSLYRSRVCFAGRCVEKKGLTVIRAAAIAFPDVEFVIAGRGPIDPVQWQLPNVKCVGWLERAALARIFRQSDLLLLPSRGEGFPCVVQEAMAAGLPCAIFEETWRAWGRDRDYFHLLSDHDYLFDLRQILGKSSTEAERQKISAYAKEHWSWERTSEIFARVLRDAHWNSAQPANGRALRPAVT
jgi:alpha-maltose-1-phosphate synthase